jgi:hypothetical protein
MAWKSLETFLPFECDVKNDIIEQYIKTIERNSNKLCIINPLYEGIPFDVELNLNSSDASNSSGQFTFYYPDIYDEKHEEQQKKFIINKDHNYEYFKEVLGFSSKYFREYLTNVQSFNTNNEYRYSVEGIFAIKKFLIDCLPMANQYEYMKFGHNLAYSEKNRKKKEIIYDTDLYEYVMIENNYIGKEEDQLVNHIFEKSYDANYFKDSLIITNQIGLDTPYHFKSIEKLQSLKDCGFNVKLDIGICLPIYEHIERTIKSIYSTSPYIIKGFLLECDSTVLNDRFTLLKLLNKGDLVEGIVDYSLRRL